MPPTRFTVTAERTANGWIAHCRALDLSCEGTTEDEARRNVVDAISALYGFEPAAEIDARPPEPPRVREINLRNRRLR